MVGMGYPRSRRHDARHATGMPTVTACAGGHPDDVLTCKLLRPVGPSCASGSAAERAERPQGNEHNRLLLPI